MLTGLSQDPNLHGLLKHPAKRKKTFMKINRFDIQQMFFLIFPSEHKRRRILEFDKGTYTHKTKHAIVTFIGLASSISYSKERLF